MYSTLLVLSTLLAICSSDDSLRSTDTLVSIAGNDGNGNANDNINNNNNGVNSIINMAATIMPPLAPIGGNCTSDADCESDFCYMDACRADAHDGIGRPTAQLHVIDNFYHEPLIMRQRVLDHGVFHTRGNYPGVRTDPWMTQSVMDALVRFLGKNFTYWPTDLYNGAWQYTTRDMRSWIHCDNTQWAGVLFLTPRAPLNSGTRFYRHKSTRLTERPTEADALRLGFNTSAALLAHLYKDSQNYDAWHLVDEVANVFNRLILFRGFRFHQSAEYFGHDLRSARLFQTFFFDC